jgi:hypothetical protein
MKRLAILMLLTFALVLLGRIAETRPHLGQTAADEGDGGDAGDDDGDESNSGTGGGA